MPEDKKVEGTEIPGEDGEGHSQSPNLQAERESAQEVKARAQGWKPEEEWSGDPADWVPAKEFLGRQSLFDKIHSLRTENKKLSSDIEVIKNYVSQMSQVEYNRALNDLRAQKREAIKEADVEATEEIDKQIGNLQQARQQPAVNAVPPPEFNEWIRDNQWYSDDLELRQEADILGAGYVNNATQNGKTASVADTLKYVSGKIKRMYPEKFEQTATKKKVAADVEEGGGSGISVSRKGKFSEADLNDQERKVMNALIARKVVTKEKYLADLSARYGK